MTTDVIVPWISAAGADGLRRSMQAYQGDGTNGPWEFNFAGGYIRPEHLRAYRYDPSNASATPLTLTLIGSNQATSNEPIPPDQFIVLYRDTPKDRPLVDYTDGAVMDEKNLDMVAQQAVFVAAETADRFDVINATVGDALAVSEAARVAAAASAAQAAADAATASAAANQAQARWDDIHGKFTVSTEQPSGGKDGDIWFQIASP